MKNIPITIFFAAVFIIVVFSPKTFALDQLGLTGEFSLPDRSHNLVDSQDDYYDAVQRSQDADAAVVRARESAIKQLQTRPDYIDAVKAVDQTYQAFIEKKNALVDDLQKKNPMYTQMRSESNKIDTEIETARQNLATPPEQFKDLYDKRETFNRQWQQQENDAMERAGLTPLRQQWLDTCKRLSDLQDKQRVDAENTEKLKAAIAMADDARNAVQQARAAISEVALSPQITSSEQSRAADFLCKYSGAGFAGNDAWLTYGWNTAPAAKAAK